MTANSYQEKWARICSLLRAEFGDSVYHSWLKAARIEAASDGNVRIGVPTRFMSDWIETNYGERIRALWSQEGVAPSAVSITVSPIGDPAGELPPPARTVTVSSPTAPAPVAPVAPSIIRPAGVETVSKNTISAPLDLRYTFDNFVVGKPNEFAYAAAHRVAESDQVSFNPLFLYGGVGLGKTHLMHAIAWEIRRQNAGRTVIYLSAEKFMYRFIQALRDKNTISFKEQLRSVDVLMIDDVQFISGKDSTQEEFFHTFNSLVDKGRQIVISADKSPSDLAGMEERLRSRLGCGLVADIHATTYELRLGILESKAEHLSITIPGKVLEFLAHKISSNVRELEGALNRVVAHAQLIGRVITLEMAQDVLRDLLRANDRRATIEEVQKKVAEHFNIRLSDMHSVRRSRQVSRPRQVAMYLSKQLTSSSLPEIGRKFGGRDHTTVMHAIKKVEELQSTDKDFAGNVELLLRMLSE